MATPAKKKNRRLWWIIGAVLLLLLILALMKGKKGTTGTEVTAEKTSKRTILETVEASGKIYPETEVAITSEVSGTIVELFVQEGDSVREGQLLARINADAISPVVDRAESAVKSTEAQTDNLRAQLAQAQNQIDNARLILRRNDQLLKDGLIAQAEYDNAVAAVKTAESGFAALEQSIRASNYNVESARASVKESRENLRRTNIFAPMRGIVSKLSKKKGEQVVGTLQMAGTEIMRIANLNALEVRVNVNEIEILKVTQGDTAEITVDAYPDRKFKGIVTHIANSANNLSSSTAGVEITSDKATEFQVKIHMLESSYNDLLANKNIPFRPGMSASVEIHTEMLRDVLSVPVGAVTMREDTTKGKRVNAEYKQLVFVHVADTVATREVKTGIQDDSYIFIKSGLAEGDEVVTGPYTAVSRKLKQGDKIKVVKEKDLYNK